MAGEATEPKPMDADATMSPVDLPGDEADEDRPLAWTSVAIAAAAAFLLLTNAVSIDGWAKELPPGAATERLTDLTGLWLAATDTVGLGAPRAFVHRYWKRAEAAQFHRDPAGR